MKLPAQIGLFLGQLKKILETTDIVFVERYESLQFMADRGMTEDDLKDRFLELKASECFDGPEPDRDEKYKEFTVAEFDPVWNGERIYLKASICSEKIVCKCLSVKEYKEKDMEDGAD